MAEYGMETSTIALQEKVQTQPSTGKLLFTVFWDSQGTILEHYQEMGTTINSTRYSEMLLTD